MSEQRNGEPHVERRNEERRKIDQKYQGYQDWVLTLFNKGDEGLMTTDDIAKRIALAMTIRDLRKERANEMAERDPLTDLYNRGAFDKFYDSLIEKGNPFGLLIIDIDHFKRVNDTYGHPVGDEVLIQTALNIITSVRQIRPDDNQNDVVARYGGEEIAVLLANINNREDLLRIAETIRTSIGNHSFRVRKKEIPITVSVGGGIRQNEEKKDFFDNVDQALYQAKEQGRNRSVIVGMTS